MIVRDDGVCSGEIRSDDCSDEVCGEICSDD